MRLEGDSAVVGAVRVMHVLNCLREKHVVRQRAKEGSPWLTAFCIHCRFQKRMKAEQPHRWNHDDILESTGYQWWEQEIR